MGIIKTKGIVLKQNNMGDNDEMCTILTPDLGKNWMCRQRCKKAKE